MKSAMGKHQSKIDNPNANIINEVEMVQPTNDNMYLIIITVLLSAQLAIQVYQLHKKALLKRYLNAASVANQLDKI